MGKAERLYDPNPQVDRSKLPPIAEVRESIRRDAKRLLDPFNKKAQAQRGMTKYIAKLKCE